MKKLEVKKEDLIYNLNSLRNYIGDDTKVIAVVKANAMGLGLVECSKVLVENKVDMLAVSTPDEAFTLRENGIECKILLLTPIYNEEIVRKLVNRNIILTIDSK
jgi:alanine racemase